MIFEKNPSSRINLRSREKQRKKKGGEENKSEPLRAPRKKAEQKANMT